MPDALPRHPKGDACRLCLVSREEMEPIFSDPVLALTITETVRLEIYEGDGLPAQICQPCIDQLNTASRFIQRCHMSDAQLRLPLFKECARTGELEVTSSVNVETATAEPILEGNWACSLTPIKTELREELDSPPLNTGDFSEVNLKSEVLEHPLEGVDPLEESSHELTEPADETIWDDDSAGTPNYLDWKTSSPPNNSGWQDNSLQTPCSWQTSHEEVWQDQSLQPSGGMGWPSSSLQAYNSMMWQHSTQEQNSTKCHRVDLERKTKEATSLSEINSSFNCSGDGVLIEPSADVSATHENTPLNTEKYSSNYLLGFQNVTENQPLFTCYLCPKSFTTNRALSCHINMGHKQKNHHKGDSFQRFSPGMPEKSRLWCSLCSTGFSQREELVKHLHTHQGHSSYYCSRCDKGFQSQQALKVHTKTHAKEKRYKCTKCEKSFSLRSYFRVHELTHKKK